MVWLHVSVTIKDVWPWERSFYCVPHDQPPGDSMDNWDVHVVTVGLRRFTS